jgi:leader peptidase (prepilin peptidase)/N-methyltransferase
LSFEPGDIQDRADSPSSTSLGRLDAAVVVLGLSAAVAVAVAYRTAPIQAVLLVAMVVVSTWLSVIDFREHRLPNRIVGPLALAVLVSVLAAGLIDDDLARSWRALGFGAALSAILLLANIVGGLGMGDVKYGFPMAATVGWFGWDALSIAVMITTVTAAGFAIVLLVRGGGRHQQLAYGPFMALGMAVGLLAAAPW